MRVLLLGGTGTLSSAVLKRTLEKGWNISVFNRGNNNKNIPSDVEIIKGDFKQIANCDKCIPGNSVPLFCSVFSFSVSKGET